MSSGIALVEWCGEWALREQSTFCFILMILLRNDFVSLKKGKTDRAHLHY